MPMMAVPGRICWIGGDARAIVASQKGPVLEFFRCHFSPAAPPPHAAFGAGAGSRRDGVAAAAALRPGARDHPGRQPRAGNRSEEHTSELQSLMRISYAVFCLNTQKKNT